MNVRWWHTIRLSRGRCNIKELFLLAGMAFPSFRCQAQTSAVVAQVAESILTRTALATTIRTLTVDSLRIRPTPSAALDRTAQYFATQLQQLGFQPGLQRWDSVTRTTEPVWLLRYPLPGQQRLDYVKSSVSFETVVTANGRPIATENGAIRSRWAAPSLARTAHFSTGVAMPAIAERLVGGYGQDQLGRVDVASSGQAVLVAGPQSKTSLAAAQAATPLADCVVIYVPPAGGDSTAERLVLERLYATARGVVIVRNIDSVEFAAAVTAGRRRSFPIVESYLREATGPRRWPWAIEVWPGAVAGVLAAAGIDMPTLWATTVPIARTLETLQVKFEAITDPVSSMSLSTAPIVAGLLPGANSTLAQEDLILVTHMDTPAVTDTAPGATDAASVNLAGLLALARAFREPGARPRRSVLVVATSGEAGRPVAWGSHFLAEQPVALNQDLFGIATCVLAFDLAGRSDSALIEGGGALELMPSPVWLAAMHPELGLTVIDAGTLPVAGSSASAFARMLMPSLLLHRPSATRPMPAVDDHTVRLLRYVLYLGYQLATAERFPPLWSSKGRAFLQSSAP